MTNGAHRLWSRQRRRATVSLSLPTANSVPVEPIEQLDRAIEIIHRVNRTFPEPGLDCEELIALAGLLTQIGAALLQCRNSYVDARTSARAFHAAIKR